jgi:predicted dehydrogenase
MSKPMKRQIRVGVVGYGKMGRIRCDSIRSRSDADLVAVFDPFADFSDIPDISQFSDWESFLLNDLDAVIISCTNDLIPDFAIEALSRGLHVFCEKPPGRSLPDVVRIQAATKLNPAQKLKFGFNHRYHQSVEDAYSYVESGRLGRLLWMRGTYGKAGGAGFAANWRNDPKKSGGGILLDQGIHMLDLFHVFAGEFEEVKSFIGNQFWDVAVEDNAFAILRNDEGQVCMLHSSATQWKHTFRLEICLEKGFLALNGILSSTMTYGRESLTISRCNVDDSGHPIPNPEESISFYDHDLSWEREMEEFISSIREDLPIRIGTIEHATAAMRAVERIYKADRDSAMPQSYTEGVEFR